VNAYEEIRKKDNNILEVIPFNSIRKKASIVLRHPDHNDKIRVYLKGAPEFVL
jgi:magnesium-transporting ATPase (P-type)